MVREHLVLVIRRPHVFHVRREPDGPELEFAELRRSERPRFAGIGLDHVRYVHGASQQRDLLVRRRREHAELPVTVATHLAVLLRVARRVPTRRDAARRDRLSRLVAAACPTHAAHRRHLIPRRVHHVHHDGSGDLYARQFADSRLVSFFTYSGSSRRRESETRL